MLVVAELFSRDSFDMSSWMEHAATAREIEEEISPKILYIAECQPAVEENSSVCYRTMG